MNILSIVNFFCLAAVVSGWQEHDGSWKGEGLAESQDHGSWGEEAKGHWGVHHYAPAHKWEPAPIGHDGRVVDTPEVAHAKAAHLAVLEAARAHAPADKEWDHQEWAPEPKGWAPEPKGWAPAAKGLDWAPAHKSWEHEPKYHGPPAHIELTHDGKNLKDTPEVSHAKAEHFAAIAKAKKIHAPAYYHGLW